MTTAKSTTKSTKKSAINSIAAQAGTLTVTVQTVPTRKASAKAIKSCAPLVSAMRATGEDTSAELLARLPNNTIAFQCFAQNALGTAQLFSWFDDNQTSLKRTTKEGKTLLNMAGAYCAAFSIVHDRAVDGPLKNMPFYKKLSNALQQWAKRQGGFETRSSGSITDTVCAYLDKKQREDSAALSNSVTAWILKHEDILARIKEALETPAA